MSLRILFAFLLALFAPTGAYAAEAIAPPVQTVPEAELRKFAERLAALRPARIPDGASTAAEYWWDYHGVHATAKAAGAAAFSEPSAEAGVVLQLSGTGEYPVVGKVAEWTGIEIAPGNVGWVKDDLIQLAAELPDMPYPDDADWFQRRIFDVLQEAAQLRADYLQSPYVNVTGFEISLGFSPTVNVQFVFK